MTVTILFDIKEVNVLEQQKIDNINEDLPIKTDL